MRPAAAVRPAATLPPRAAAAVRPTGVLEQAPAAVPAAVLLPAVVETTEKQKTLEYQFTGTRLSGGQYEDSVVTVGRYRVRVRRQAVPATFGGANQRAGGPPWPPSLASEVPPDILSGP